MNDGRATSALNAPVDLGDGLTAVDIWQSLHAGERRWKAKSPVEERLPFRQYTDSSDRQLMTMLASFPAQRWVSLCNGAGWTQIGCVALSWCEETTLAAALHYWRKLRVFPEPGSAAERAATFFNPALLPNNDFSALIDAGEDVPGVALLIAARPDAPKIDISADQYERLNASVKNLIDHRRR